MSTSRGPGAYVHGGGSVVVVPGRIAALLVRHAGLARYHVDNRGLDPELDDVLVALKVAAAAWRTSATAGSAVASPPEVVAQSEQRLTSSAAADLLGISDRAVRLAIGEKRLPAERVGRRWLISREDVEHYKAARAA